jgi:hypothetical protein
VGQIDFADRQLGGSNAPEFGDDQFGLHAHSLLTDQRLEEYAQAVAGRSICQPEAAARATALLARAVQNQAYVLACIDGFMVLGFAVISALFLMLFLRDPPARLNQPVAKQSCAVTTPLAGAGDA